ncbi:DNA-binding transcriptional regulator, MerR family [Amycolatopsis xylanica]|uniref:DNA-binding transcriptional regulator, MerR family n=1 Tax=Amycolatopsis xylanica TaxID=589385 RepID=A0A1H2VJE1_9PSEU|nr:MerR family transcriptional regulator [Amycolatopsis xylanica]SDW68461.1 DNA-binding transcriptional regulator, MerR family [Amycolatopsis xylanica]
MFTIGDFARLGQVSVRMLRHYDAIGLLRPVEVDPSSGYRFYGAEQLRRLNRLVALKDLGFTLRQVGEILDDKVGADELRGMLRLRQGQLEAQIEADMARLAGVESRLRMIDLEDFPRTAEVTVKAIPAVRVAEVSALAAGYEGSAIGPVIQTLFPRLGEVVTAAGLEPDYPAIAYYTSAGNEVAVHAAVPVAADPDPAHGFDIVDLPAIECAATMLHHGPMDDIGASFQALARWIDHNGHRTLDFAREVYLECGEAMITELQVAITKGRGSPPESTSAG